MTIAEVLPEPLPLVLDEAPDESLSSWLNRHAEFYGVSPSALNLRAGINTPSFARIDYWPTAGEACSIASAMRRTPEMILSMTHQPYHGRLATMIARGKPVLACPECQTIHRRDRRATVLLKSWSHGWRITCPVCSSRLQEITEGKIYPPANAFDHVWDEARNGEEMLAGIDQLPTDRAAFAVALLHLLLLPRSRTRNDVQRQIWRGRVLDVVIPGFDDVDRHAPFTVHTATPLVAPLPIRVALLAGLWRTQNNPDLYDRIESACSGRESIRFDAAKIKLLADAHPAFSHLQQIRELESVLVSLFPAAKAKNRPSLKISCNVTSRLPVLPVYWRGRGFEPLIELRRAAANVGLRGNGIFRLRSARSSGARSSGRLASSDICGHFPGENPSRPNGSATAVSSAFSEPARCGLRHPH